MNNESTPLILESLEDNFNFVIVRVWEGTPGHVSLETRNIYASLWPEEPVEKGGTLKVIHGKLNTYAEDLHFEGNREAENQFILRLSRISDLESYYINFVNTKLLKWNLLGSNLTSKKSYNCSGLVHKLLNVGGFKDIVKPTKMDKNKLSISSIPFLLLGLTLFSFGKKKNNHAMIYAGYFFIAIALSISTIGGLYVCYTKYCSPIARTVLGRGLVSTPAGIKRLMSLSKAEKFEGRFNIYSEKLIQSRDIVVTYEKVVSDFKSLHELVLTTEFIKASRWEHERYFMSHSDSENSNDESSYASDDDFKKDAFDRQQYTEITNELKNVSFDQGRDSLIKSLELLLNITKYLRYEDKKIVIEQIVIKNLFDCGRYIFLNFTSSTVDKLKPVVIQKITDFFDHIQNTASIGNNQNEFRHN